MNKASKYAAIAAGAAAGVLLYLIAPGHARPEQKSPFTGRNLAHRGLHNEAAGIPENSLAAFRAAAEAGYGVELDTRLTKDGYVVVSHDDCVKRMTGADVCVSETDLADLQQLRLLETDERIPLFADVLRLLCRANVPVCVEVKPGARREELCRKVLDIIDENDGEICVESFDPRIVRWFRRNAPDLLRGQLTTEPGDLDGNFFARFAVSRLLTNFLARPQFIAHGLAKKSLNARLCHLLGALRVCWTAHDRSAEAYNDVVIFENYQPPRRFK